MILFLILRSDMQSLHEATDMENFALAENFVYSLNTK